MCSEYIQYILQCDILKFIVMRHFPVTSGRAGDAGFSQLAPDSEVSSGTGMQSNVLQGSQNLNVSGLRAWVRQDPSRIFYQLKVYFTKNTVPSFKDTSWCWESRDHAVLMVSLQRMQRNTSFPRKTFPPML